MIQIWFTENTKPSFTEENGEEYSQFGTQQCFPVGCEVNGRRLIRSLMPAEKIGDMVDYLNELGKEVIICDVRNQDGTRYGFKRQVESVDPETTYSIVPETYTDEDGNVQEITPYPVNEEEHDKHFAEQTCTDEDGNQQTYTPSDNKASGWAGWEDRLS